MTVCSPSTIRFENMTQIYAIKKTHSVPINYSNIAVISATRQNKLAVDKVCSQFPRDV